ncbi:MAG: transglutaminase domain-containing protein [Candidatus Marinimicrobia bacterium]|nr:transglutaminase domain-containing protein [Candidatus Neomarinimicrobiota bacterium]
MKLKNFSLSSLLIIAGVLMSCESTPGNNYQEVFDAGEFTKARASITHIFATNQTLDPQERLEMEFLLERMNRIEKDFTKTRKAVVAEIKETIPDVSDEDIRRWEESKALEFRIIDGEKRYFNRAARNLFRIDPTAKAIWEEKHPEQEMTSGSGAKLELDKHYAQIIRAVETTGQRYVKPIRMRITQSIDVEPGVVPEGEMIRAWIPFPRYIRGRQVDISLKKATPAQYILAPSKEALQRTIYFQAPALNDEPTHFQVSYEYTSYGMYAPVMAESVEPLQESEKLAPYLAEEPPHIVFTPELRKLSERLLQGEQNPYRKAQILFEWVDNNIPWASAREYSTIGEICTYAYENGHGDCGIQTLLFITLCRMNGIPTKWQSGWEFQPPDDSMHDWGVIYFEPYGWVPMDVTYGLRNAKEQALRWFYLSGMDSYRLIFNDAVSQPFFPAKIFPRSETIDSQRGEVEWRGGNLYFDQWDWNLAWEVLETS